VFLQVYPQGRALQDGQGCSVRGHNLRGTAAMIQRLLQAT
jgi:hypothetical protein